MPEEITYQKEEDKLVTIKPPVVTTPEPVKETRAELNASLEDSRSRRAQKVLEIDGIDQEIALLLEKLAKCDELGI